MDSNRDDKQGAEPELGLGRRAFLKVAGAVAAAAGALPLALKAGKVLADADPPDTVAGTVFIYSSCQMCHSRCGIKAKVQGGQLVKIDGNPYHPNNRGEDERLTFATAPSDARPEFGRLCPKGQSGIQTLYDPYRIQHPLKRVGARGSGQWETITWTQAFNEIGAQINTLIPFATRNTAAIDAASLDLGKVANQLLFSPGRSIEKEISERVFKSGFGTVNFNLDHTSICEASHHVANKMMTKDHVVGTQGPNHFKTDMNQAEYMLVFGGNPVEANFPMLALARGNADMRDRARIGGAGRVVIVDPRFSNSAAKADQWVAVRPGGDAALALGMGRVILDGARYNAGYLRNANKAAATAAGEPTYTDATWLVIVQAGHANEGKFLTALEAGIASPGDAANPVCIRDSDGAPAEVQVRVVVGTPAAVVGQLEPVDAGLDYVTVNGIRCRTAFEVYKLAVHEHTLDQYAVLSGIDTATITGLATDFTSHGRKASAWTYRGVVKHTNGTYAQLAVMALNWMIGNVDYAGGLLKGGGSWDQKNATGGVSTMTVPGAASVSGPQINRAGADYTPARSYFSGYPAPRVWLPFASEGSYQEIIPSIEDGYPYSAKVLITYWNAWPYSVPGGKATWERVVADTTRLPLLVAISPVMGEVAAWADYVLPDTTYLEKWSFPGGNAAIAVKESPIQQPVVGAYDGVAIGATDSWTFDPAASNDYTPLLPDTKMHADIMIGLAKGISATFPGVGTDALGAGRHLDRAWDFYRHQFNNLAINVGTSITGAAVTVSDIIARGGAFALPNTAYDTVSPNLMNAKYGGVLHFWVPQLATATNSITGQKFRGVAHWTPPAHADGAPVADGAMFPLQLVTYKSVLHAQARTHVNPWLMMLRPENSVDLSASDARAIGVETGDRVRIVSPSNLVGVVGMAKVTQGLRPGVVAVSHHYGHWENSSRPFTVDGAATSFDATRGAGLTANPIMRLDDFHGNVSLQDVVGGSVAFNDTWVRVEPVA